MEHAPPKVTMGLCGVFTFILNLFVLAIGGIIIAGASYLLHFLANLESGTPYITMSWHFVIAGVFVVLVSIMAFVGVSCCNRCFLCVHILGMCSISVFAIIAGLVVIINLYEIHEGLQFALMRLVYEMNERGVTNNLFKKFQSLLGCCGSHGPGYLDKPEKFCCEGSEKSCNYPYTGCVEALEKFWDTYGISIGASLIGFGIIMAIPVWMACRTRKGLSFTPENQFS
nr:tetraspanin [Hymenolepis microstoma]